MKQKYYPQFKNYSEFQKILAKNDYLFKISTSSSLQSPSSASISKIVKNNSINELNSLIGFFNFLCLVILNKKIFVVFIIFFY